MTGNQSKNDWKSKQSMTGNQSKSKGKMGMIALCRYTDEHIHYLQSLFHNCDMPYHDNHRK